MAGALLSGMSRVARLKPKMCTWRAVCARGSSASERVLQASRGAFQFGPQFAHGAVLVEVFSGREEDHAGAEGEGRPCCWRPSQGDSQPAIGKLLVALHGSACNRSRCS